jgi:hypothetical protein
VEEGGSGELGDSLGWSLRLGVGDREGPPSRFSWPAGNGATGVEAPTPDEIRTAAAAKARGRATPAITIDTTLSRFILSNLPLPGQVVGKERVKEW